MDDDDDKEDNDQEVDQVNRWWRISRDQQGHKVWCTKRTISVQLKALVRRSPVAPHLPCLGCDPTARVASDRSHKGLEPQGDMRGGVLACSTACTSNQRRGLPTQSWYQEFEHFPGLLGQAFLFQPPDHPQIVKRTAKKRLKRMKAFVKYFSMRKSMKEQS